VNLGGRLRAQWWLIASIVSLLILLLTVQGGLYRWDNLSYDRFLKLFTHGYDNDIVLVEIDDESLARNGRWPWSRNIHAELINRLAAGAPRAIVYDTLFTEPSDPSDDAALSASMARAGNVFVPLYLSEPRTADGRMAIFEPIQEINEVAAGTGFTDYMVDSDGVLRSVSLDLHATPIRRHLIEAVYRALEPDKPEGNQGTMIPFCPPDRRRHISASAILNGVVSTQTIRSKIVMVGVTASGVKPQYPVVGLGTFSGLEIDAQLLRALLDNRMVTVASLNVQIAFALAPLWLLMVAMRLTHRPSLALLAIAIAILAATFTDLLAFHLWLPPVKALLAIFIAFPVWGWRQLAVTQQFMRQELKLLSDGRRIIPQETILAAPQRLDSTLTLLTAALADNRSMRQFIGDSLDQLPDATLVTSTTGNILLINAFARKLFGEEAVRSDPATNVTALLGRFRDASSREVIEVPTSPGRIPIIYDAVTAEGHFYTIRFTPRRTEQDVFTGWIVQLMDISEAKATARQRDDILELLTHDMRSPQASILAVLEMAPAQNIEPETVRRIRHYAERTLGLADGFVQLLRAQALEYVLEEVVFGEMLIDAIDDLWPQATAKGITIELCDQEEPLFVNVERSLITRSLINVLDNAVKYSPAQSQITCTLGRGNGPLGEILATCRITDHGPGLDAEHKTAIFKRFHRGPLGLRRQGPDGVGLGLSFVHMVMVRHGGEIRCESELGQGTSFTFVLPVVAALIREAPCGGWREWHKPLSWSRKLGV